MADKPVRLADVASACGVSTACVSRILNCDEDLQVREELRQRVVATARRLGYRPNHVARSLRTRRTMTIGVAHLGNTDPGALLEHIEPWCRQRCYEMLLTMSDRKAENVVSALERLAHRHVDGALLLRPEVPANEPLELRSWSRRLPLVCVGVAPAADVDSVDWDRAAGVGELAQRLRARGARRFALVADYLSIGVQQRLDGLRVALAEVPGHALHQVGCEQQRGDAPSLRELAAQAKAAVLEHGVQALICRSDPLAVLVCVELERAGLRVGREVAVAGSSDSALAAQWEPPLTTVAVPWVRIVERALDRLLRRIEGDGAAATAERMPAQLLERASTADFSATPLA